MTHERRSDWLQLARRASQGRPLWQTLLIVALLAGAYWITREREPAAIPGESKVERPAEPSDAAHNDTPRRRKELPGPRDDFPQRSRPERDDQRAGERDDRPSSYTIPNVTILDQKGQVAWRGDVDLSKTIGRIERGERLRFASDGSVFENRERRLPREKSGYYHEYIHPTPRLAGPGPQRVVVGAGGEIYYTSDHYRTFITIRGP